MAALLLDVGSRHDLGWKMKPISEVLETLRSQSVVVVLPGEAGLEVATGGEGLAGFDDLNYVSPWISIATNSHT